MTLEDFKQEGYEEGIEIGIREGIQQMQKENVFNGLNASFPDDVILTFSRISKEELEEYKEEYRKEISFPHSSI